MSNLPNIQLVTTPSPTALYEGHFGRTLDASSIRRLQPVSGTSALDQKCPAFSSIPSKVNHTEEKKAAGGGDILPHCQPHLFQVSFVLGWPPQIATNPQRLNRYILTTIRHTDLRLCRESCNSSRRFFSCRLHIILTLFTICLGISGRVIAGVGDCEELCNFG